MMHPSSSSQRQPQQRPHHAAATATTTNSSPPPSSSSSPSPFPTPSSIYQAIEHDNWEGLLALYATAAYDAVYSAEFAARSSSSSSSSSRYYHHPHSLGEEDARQFRHGGGGRGRPSLFPSSALMASTGSAAGSSRSEGLFFRDEKKMERPPKLGAEQQQQRLPRVPSIPFSSSTLQELESIVRKIMGDKEEEQEEEVVRMPYADPLEDARDDAFSSSSSSSLASASAAASSSSPNNANNHRPINPYKKTRQNSPPNRSTSAAAAAASSSSTNSSSNSNSSTTNKYGKSSPGFSALDRLLKHSNPAVIAAPTASYRTLHSTSSATNSSSSNNNNNNGNHRRSHSPPSPPSKSLSASRLLGLPMPASTSHGSATAATTANANHHHHHHHHHSQHQQQSQHQCQHEWNWEKVMWESASVLSNSRPSLSYVVHRSERRRRDSSSGGCSSSSKGSSGENEESGGECHLKSNQDDDFEEEDMEDSDYDDDDDEDEDEDEEQSFTNTSNNNNNNNNNTSNSNRHQTRSSSPPLFEGTIANSTPGDPVTGGAGSGTTQHLACLLDSPLALSILLVLGVNVEARHTAFRRLAVHEAACADSPRCLGLLLEAGRRFSMELCLGNGGGGGGGGCRNVGGVNNASGKGDGAASSSDYATGAMASYAAASATGFGSSFDGSESSSSSFLETGANQEESRGGGTPSKKLGGKLKLNFFSGCGWNMDGRQSSRSGRGRSSFGDVTNSKKKSTHGGDDFLNPSSAVKGGKVRKTDVIPFPAALTIIWEAIQLVRSGDMSEMDAARHILDQVSAPLQSKRALALQCPHLPSNTMKDSSSEEKTASAPSSPFASLHGIVSFVGAGSTNHSFYHPQNSMQGPSYASGPHNVDGHGNTPLHWASFKNSVRAMDVLLSYNVDVNSRAQPSGWTPLHDAAYSNSADAVARLLAAGAHVDARSHSGATPLCFAAQEDAPNATQLLMEAGADPSMRCLGQSSLSGVYARGGVNGEGGGARQNNQHFQSRFSGYTPLHYCAHYNAARAARVLLYGSNCRNRIMGVDLLEIPDLNEKLPIHVAVARGSSEVLRELLHGGARVDTVSCHSPPSPRGRLMEEAVVPTASRTTPVSIPTEVAGVEDNAAVVVTPVSSPVLRSMIPSHPITSSKPWNCLSQKAIDACRSLIEEVEMNWTPERHALFSPMDRIAVKEVLHVGKRLEQQGSGIFLELWPFVLSFCGRGWFEPLDLESQMTNLDDSKKNRSNDAEDVSMQSSSDEDVEFTQFNLEETSMTLL